MRRSSKRAAVLVSAAALLALIIPPFIHVNRYRARLAETISKSLSRPVTLGDISLRMLPQPQFVMQNVVIGDDPAFSAEPMLRSEEVTATLRISSLWRGRLEIAKLHFRYPSLNLVRDQDDRWNFESLLNTAKQVPSAPTSKKQAESRPRFPYIESDSGRINFKSGAEKKAFALADADFALWQESENQWNMRLEARPIRTDANLEDTGTFRLEGYVQRAQELRASPIKMRVELERAQLGQFSHYLSGQDRGWRGDIAVRADLEGTPEELRFTAQASVDNFRRYDLSLSEPLSLEAKCEGVWNGAVKRQQTHETDPAFANVECRSSLGKGTVMLDASLRHGEGWRIPDKRLVISGLPLSAVGTVLRHAKANLPNDFAMSGTADADFQFAPCDGTGGCWEGGATLTDAVTSSGELKSELHFPTITLAYASSQAPAKKKRGSASAPQSTLSVLPFHLQLGTAGRADVSGNVEGGRLTLSTKGKGPLPEILTTARLLGLRATKSQVTGDAQFDLTISASPMELVPPVVLGTAKLQNLLGRVPGMAAPLQIAAIDVVFHPESIDLRNMRGAILRTRTSFDGGLTWHRCDAAPCAVDFDLHANELDLEDLNRLLNPALRASGWKDLPKLLFGNDASQAGRFPALRASGTLRADSLLAKSIIVTKVAARVALVDSVLEISDLTGDLASGTHKGEWRADFSSGEPQYRGNGTLQNVNVSALSQLFGSTSAAGKADATYAIALAGADAAALARSAMGTVGFHWQNGVLRQVPLQFKLWAGKVEFAKGKGTLLPGTIQTAKGTMDAHGEITFPRDINLVLQDGAQSMTVVGPLEKPSVSISRAQAASNPLNDDVHR